MCFVCMTTNFFKSFEKKKPAAFNSIESNFLRERDPSNKLAVQLRIILISFRVSQYSISNQIDSPSRE